MEPQVKRAVELTRRGWSANKIAQELNVNRSTVSRWKQSKAFQEALAEEPSQAEIGDVAREGLSALVPEALRLLERALTNDMSAAKMNAARGIIRDAIELGGGSDGAGPGGLATRLAELDKRGVESD